MVVEKAQDKRLKELGINIKTIFKQDNQILERNTDSSKNDTIKNGIILEKDYYKGILLKKENVFDSRILYTYVFDDKKVFKCNNCGAEGKVEDFENGCLYCHTEYNMEYEDKELGSKHYFDLTVKNKNYIYKTLLLDITVSFIIVLLYILGNSRTFYLFDILKVIIGTILISLLLFYIFYYIDALILLPSLKRKKELLNKKQQDFWMSLKEKGVDKIKFYNNLNYELRELFYSERYKDIIDFDIIDYLSFEEKEIDNNLKIKVKVDIRIVKCINGKVISKEEEKEFLLKRVKEYNELNKGANLITCPGCGSSIDVTKKSCSYCGKKINYFQEWYLEKEL